MVQDGYPPQDNCVVAEGGEYEEGECSDGEPPPPPPAPRPVNSQSFPPVKHNPVQEEGEEGECESDEEEGELEGVPKKETVVVEETPKDAWPKLDTENTKPIVKEEKVPSPPKEPKPEPREQPPAIAKINNKLEDIATRKNTPVPPPPAPLSRDREPNYRDRDYRERPNDWRPPPEGHSRDGRNANGHGFNDQRMRGPPPMERPRTGDMARAIPHPEFNRKPFQHQLPKPPEKKRDLPTAGMRPGDMPSLISLPPMPQLNSSKGKVPEFPPMPSPYGPTNVPHMPHPPPAIPNQPPGWNAPARPPVMHPAIPLYPDRNPGNRDPNREREHTNNSRGGEHIDDRHIRDYYNFYNRAWDDYYKGKSSSDRHRGRDGRDRSPERGGFPPPMPGAIPGMPGMPPGMPGMPPGMPGMPPGMPMPEQRGRSKESAWLRGLKANQKVLEEVKRKPEAVTDDEESDDEPKVHSRIVMKSPALPEDQRSHRSRPTPDDQGSYKSHHTPDSSPDANGHPASRSGHGSEHGSTKRLTPERYRGVYERKPLPEERKPRKKSEERKRVGDVEWRDPWMRPGTSPKDRKRPLSKSSSSSDSTTGSSSPDIGALKAHYKKDKARRKREFLEAEKLRKLKHKLSPSDYELLMKKRSREIDLPRNYAKRETRNETESESEGESGSSSSSSIGSMSPGMAGKLADSPTSPPSSPDMRRGKKNKVSPGGSINSTKRKKEILLKELQKVEDKLKRKKDDTRKHR